MTRLLAIMVLCYAVMNAHADLPKSLRGVHRILFLGDSITYSGQYVELVDATLATRYPDHPFDIIDLGLPSETVSGLTEPGHAGGAFPRPDLHERLDRALAKTRPDLVVACYGMNDGIYYPFAEERFAKYRDGIEWLAEKVKRTGAKLLLLTPPVFDPEPIRANTLPAGLAEYTKPYVGYDEVLTRYAKWLLDQRKRGWWVEDVHGPMRHHLDAMRQQQGQGYHLADDGVHCNVTGHRIIADAVLRAWKVPYSPVRDDVMKLAEERQRLLKDAWLTDVGHKRPGMAKGIPLPEAQATVEELGRKMLEIASKGKNHP